MFIESKVWISDYGYDATLQALDTSAGKLGVDTIDLFILYQALPYDAGYSVAATRALLAADSAERVAAQVARIFSPSAVGVSGSAV